MQAVLDNWCAVRDALDDIANDTASPVEAGSTAAGFVRSMSSFDFLSSFDFWFGVSLSSLLFTLTNPVAKAVQSSTATVSYNIGLLRQLEKRVIGRKFCWKFSSF